MYRAADRDSVELTKKCFECTWLDDPCREDPKSCQGPFEWHRASAFFALMRHAELLLRERRRG